MTFKSWKIFMNKSSKTPFIALFTRMSAINNR